MSRDTDHAQLSELLRSFGESMRSRLANLRSAAETLDTFPEMEKDRRRRLQGVVLEESRALTEILELGLKRLGAWTDARRPREVLGSRELLVSLAEELQEGGYRTTLAEEATMEDFEVEADLPALSRGFLRLAGDLVSSLGVEEVALRLQREPGFAALDLLWDYGEMDLENLLAWQNEALAVPSDEAAPSIPDLARRHGGEAWFNVRRQAPTAYLRLLLPVAGAKQALAQEELG
ncbi:MAG: hypothetical protein KDD47_21265 [Acidobacteria bacterium]|nr:hypothetical protein [Acidobacteriota bacterium]